MPFFLTAKISAKMYVPNHLLFFKSDCVILIDQLCLAKSSVGGCELLLSACNCMHAVAYTAILALHFQIKSTKWFYILCILSCIAIINIISQAIPHANFHSRDNFLIMVT